jgi:biotin-dependent carboxylase-like uncharacterized protein
MTATAWRVLRPGALTTVQDPGRHGGRHLGVARAGALDPEAAALANRLVGNPPDAAVLELTLNGPTLALDAPARIALCGARVDARFEDADGTKHVIAHGRPVALPAGTLRLGTARGGLRGWLAVAGGFDVPTVLGSRSTDLRGGFGGLDGRALRAGDALPIGDHVVAALDAPVAPGWWIDLDADVPRDAPIRYLPSALPVAAGLASQAWTVDPRSDRQGLRCVGDALAAELPEQVSAAVAPGTIQLPPDGHPIVLLADAQTVGGYPRLGHVIAADLPRLAQSRAGDALRFVAVSRDEARAAWTQRTARMARLEWAIDLALARKSVP